MGAGKTSVAIALGKRLNWHVDDIDELIEKRERRSVASIFKLEGEAYFRKIERSIVKDLLPKRHTIVATGGGTFADSQNRAAIIRNGATVWLDVSLELVLKRLTLNKKRPLAKDLKTIQSLYKNRLADYASAHLKLDANSLQVNELVECITQWLWD